MKEIILKILDIVEIIIRSFLLVIIFMFTLGYPFMVQDLSVKEFLKLK